MKLHGRVSKIEAQKTIDSLRSLGAIDYSYKIFSDKDFVYIPLKERVSRDGMEIIGLEGVRNELWKYPSKIRGSYDTIGSIAVFHKNIGRNVEHLARNIISMNGHIRSVYLDTGISGDLRIRNLKLLAGVDDTTTLYRENGIVLRVDLSGVYFSPRLATERMRVARSVKEGEYIIDMFSGVGPFSILIARMHSVKIVAIDKNPLAISLLKENMGLNRLKGNITAINEDVSRAMPGLSNADRIIMNLPHESDRYVELARGSLRRGGILNYYEICDHEGIAARMQEFRAKGFDIVSKREVHGYSRNEMMFSLDLIKLI